MSEQITVVAEVRRHDPSQGGEPHYQRFEVTGVDSMRVLDVIRSIYEQQAGDLAYQFACRVGRCGTCAVKVNGVPVLACQERCKPEMRIEPLTPFPVLRDLVVDRSEVETRYAALKLSPQRSCAHPGAPEPIDPALAEKLCHLDLCLACMVCVSACPAVAERPFDGPAFMLKLRHMALHPADSADRLPQALEAGMLECFNCDLCTQLCPADLSPAQAVRDFRRQMIFGKGKP
ncbi:MAG: succinate dehydrogenase/fumarate reductase iron-sulfur subunit [Burkholderiales bacterium]|nr:succinate dehydrogenase/fumarate reductase iron-sulfur subunit [Burkholderiales bacterium]